MHERHPRAAKVLCIIYSKLLGLLLGDHDRAGVTLSESPTETALAIAVGHRDGFVHARTLEQIHRGKCLRAGGT